MKSALRIVAGVAIIVLLLVVAAAIYIYLTAIKPTRRVGFQQVTIADPGYPPISAAIWYPTTAKPGFVLLGTSGERVAADGPVSGSHLPLVIFSHGTGASGWVHADTAIALAEKGFVVIAPTHTGDNFRDHSDAGKPDWLANRARHIERTIDMALDDWKDRGRIDPQRIGIFGFSAGGTTALISIGGKPDLRQLWTHCFRDPEFICQLMRPKTYRTVAQQEWPSDNRIRAAVIAAPGLGFAFAPSGLSAVNVPVQLWAGADDDIVPLVSNAGAVQRLLPRPPEMHVVAGAGHLSFMMPCGLIAPRQLCRDNEGFDRSAFHDVFNRSVVKFFQEKLPSPHQDKL